MVDTKLFRCVLFDVGGNVYRRKGSCSCESCMLRVKVGEECYGMTGKWVKLALNEFVKKTTIAQDEVSDTEHECI